MSSIPSSEAGRALMHTASGTGGLLRLVLKLDAAVTGANALAYLALAPLLSELLGIPKEVQLPAGVFLLAYALAVLVTALRPAINRMAVSVFIAGNALWSIASLAVVFAGALPATTLGSVWIVLQAVVVAGFAVLQSIGLRRQ
ncbi:MAG TPA: hypothetical protein VF815_41680 [Myxococcaceae bacterium]